MIVLALTAALLVLPATTTAETPLTLTVVTFNVYHGGPASGWTGNDGDLEARLGMTIEELRALDPDVIGLQEASISRRRGNVAARLALALGLHHVHAPATRRALGIPLLGRILVWLLDFDEGPAILSRFPIVESQIYDLPRCARRIDPRVVLRAAVASPAGPLQVFSTHTSRDDCQVTRVAEIVGAHDGDLPALLTADLNFRPEAQPVGALAAHGLVDTFAEANPGASGPTVFQRIRAASPTVSRRVDYVFAMPGRGLAPAVRSSRVILDRPRALNDGTHLWPSDHYGVLTEVALVPPSRAAHARATPAADAGRGGR
jgi:endonuclease/exonuclease/phosphatase family metal-dependent hydrolase